jgi:ribosomal protein L11 methyltransferase
MDYIEITCTLAANSDAAEASGIAIALLAELGFESFEESGDTVKAYIPAEKFNPSALPELTKEYPQLIASVDIRCIEQENWNHVWESNFPMTEIAGQVVVYAPFHTNVSALEYRISILPQMSFGTGHHETTSLMIEMMLNIDMTGKRVLDMGCGTGILAIFAAMRKARPITAIDIDEWAYRNAAENCERNGISEIEILRGDCSLLVGRSFDMALANINRNILLADIAVYAKCLPAGGQLLVSGFYTSDFPDITAETQRNGLGLVRSLEKKNWVAALYRKEED